MQHSSNQLNILRGLWGQGPFLKKRALLLPQPLACPSACSTDVMLGMEQTSWHDEDGSHMFRGRSRGAGSWALDAMADSRYQPWAVYSELHFSRLYLLTWAVFNKISLCSPNHSRFLPSRRMWLLRWEEGHGRSAGQGRGRLTRPAEEGQVWACMRNSGKPRHWSLINGSICNWLGIWVFDSGSRLKTVQLTYKRRWGLLLFSETPLYKTKN